MASDLDADRAEETAALVATAGGEAVSLEVDVSKQDELEALRDRCLHRFGRLDLVMNNVGVLAMGAPEALPLEAWQRVLDLNLLSIARSNLVFLPHLIAQGRGHVVNTSSASGLLAYGFDRLPYVASKHAVVGVSEALALYLAPRASASPASARRGSSPTSSSRSPSTARRRRPGRRSTRWSSPRRSASSSPTP